MKRDGTRPIRGPGVAPDAAGDDHGEWRGADAGPAPGSEALERAVLELLDRRADGATICPSEAARAVGGRQWRSLMEPARAAARRLVARGEVEFTQGGTVVDAGTAKGPIRIRRAGRD